MNGYIDLTKEQLIQLCLEKDIELEQFRKHHQQCKLDTDYLKTSENETSNEEALNQEGKLTLKSINRYSRQLILHEIGPNGQIKLSKTSVLLVGCGGLGCPAAQYLAGAGIGKLGLVDYDDIELNNLHRQVLHQERNIGKSKSDSIADFVNNLNKSVKCRTYKTSLTSSNALDILKDYDIVVDCSDNPATRYLVNDACVMLTKPLVSGSALRFEGHLVVYNYGNGPCYRCLYPEPPPIETVTNCGDGGVLGVIPGIIGLLQALEVIKIAINLSSGYSTDKFMIMFDGMSSTFRKLKLRKKQTSCAVCGENPTITHLIDYEQFCGARASDKEKSLNILSLDQRITAKEFSFMDPNNYLLLDVRLPIEMEICSLPKSVNVYIDEIENNIDNIKNMLPSDNILICLCHRGNDSQRAVSLLAPKLENNRVVDIIGGLQAWAKIDKSFPVY